MKAMDFIRPEASSDPLVRRAKPTPRSVPMFTTPEPKKSPSPASRQKTPSVSQPSHPAASRPAPQPPRPAQRAPQPAPRPSQPQAPSLEDSLESLLEEDIFPSRPAAHVEYPSDPSIARSNNIQVKKPSRRPAFVRHLEKKQPEPEPREERRSPFLDSVEVEKRPLGANAKILDRPDSITSPESDPRRLRQPDPVHVKKTAKKGLSFSIIILITIILGVAAGVGVYFILQG